METHLIRGIICINIFFIDLQVDGNVLSGRKYSFLPLHINTEPVCHSAGTAVFVFIYFYFYLFLFLFYYFIVFVFVFICLFVFVCLCFESHVYTNPQIHL